MKHRIIIYFVLFFIFVLACKKNSEILMPHYWTTSQDFNVPESVLHDSKRKVLYVSNIDGDPMVKDGNGYISRLSLDGKILKRKWITGFSAPKGMVLKGDELIISDIDGIHIASISKQMITHTYSVDGAVFLNDVESDNDGTIYVSDTIANKIFILKGTNVSPWIEYKEYKNINGLLFRNGYLYAGTTNGLLKIDIKTKATSLLIKIAGGIDGLKELSKERFVVTDWTGKIQIIEPGKKPVLLQDTTDKKVYAADIEYICSIKLLIVPTFTDNRIAAYKVE